MIYKEGLDSIADFVYFIHQAKLKDGHSRKAHD